MTKTTIKTLLLATALLLLFAGALAATPDLNTMTPGELQAYIQQLQNAQQPVQPTIITIQADEQLRNDLAALLAEMGSLKAANQRMEDRFGKLVDDTDAKIQESEKRQDASITNAMANMFQLQEEAFLSALRAYTNPLRQSLPQIGVFAMLAGAFLLWASKQYKLTEGIRRKPDNKQRVK